MEGVRTEELSGSNLHNYLNRLIKKSVETFLTLHLLLYQIKPKMSSFFQSYFSLFSKLIFFKNLSLLSVIIITHRKVKVKFFPTLFTRKKNYKYL
jgi:hypothetical protein